MAGKDAIETEPADHDIREILATIQDQGRQTLELLRTLIDLIVGVVGDREGPALEDLIATLVAQNRDLLTIARRIHADVRAIGDSLATSGNPEHKGHDGSGEASRV